VADLGSGIERERLNMTLKTTVSNGVAVGPRLGQEPDTIMAEHDAKRSSPGGSIAVGYRGQLILQRAYGKLEYSPKARFVTPETIYDLASLTKVVTATTLAMQLVEEGQLKLEY